MEAVILAGGLGTRLRSVVTNLPKPMAPIRGTPFLAILLDKLDAAGFAMVTMAVGYRYEMIMDYFGESYKSLKLQYSIEKEPLGTGGAIRLALEQTISPNVFVVNGDTHLELNYQSMLAAHLYSNASITIAVRVVADVSRYGSLDIHHGRISGFLEKGKSGSGTINGGIYLISRKLFENYDLPPIFSFETDFLMRNVVDLQPLSFQSQGSFIDIGIPEDYIRAQHQLALPTK